MISRIKALLLGEGGGAAADQTDEEALKLAAAALLVEAACLDGVFDADERHTIDELLQARFGLSPDESRELIHAAHAEVAESAELYRFTRVVKDRFDADQRVQLIEMLWQVAYADGQLHDYEANLVRRVAGLIYVPDRDSGAARKRVLARLGIDGDAAG